MAKKIRDVVVKVGSYQDRNTGEGKARWRNVGALMKNEDDDSLFIMLDRTFNPAGVPSQDARESILMSCFVPQDRRDNEVQNSGAGQHREPETKRQEMDDEIPF